MSLLLDALKKAAQQKARKSQQEVPEQDSSDETLIRASAADISGFDLGETGSAPEDETELDHSEIRNRLERDLSRRIAGDETGVEITEAAEVTAHAGAPATGAGDETDLDVTKAVEITAYADAPVAGDETGVEITKAVEVTAYDDAPGSDAGDETGLDVTEAAEATAYDDAPGPGGVGEATGLDIPDVTESHSIEPSERVQTDDDEIIVSAGEHLTDFTDASAPAAEDETDITQPAPGTEEVDSTLPRRDSNPDETSVDEDEAATRIAPQADADQDLSLLLVDLTDTNVKTSLTEPKVPESISQLAANTDDTLDGLGLVDTADHDTVTEKSNTDSTAITSPTQAIGGADDTRQAPGTITQSTQTRADTTSTRTYAPDNYDRTLMKPPSDDASSIFAGMKSDSDVVMTPDYAKKVFSSKTSAQRAQHYKIYAGVAVVILLAITMFGAFEYQGESDEIDTSLRPLKRDPMPGAIRLEKPEEVDLFAATDAGVSARTIEIIETANDDVTSAGTPVVTKQSEAVAEVETGGAEVAEQVASAPLTEAEVAPVEAQQTRVAEVEPVEVASSTQFAAPEAEAVEAVDNLHIESSRQVSETDTWLQEAYSAYQSGDYRLAMKRYNQVLEVDPNNRNALLARAAINIHEGYSEAAIQDYRRLLLANPKDTLAMSSLLTVANYSPADAETQLKLMIRDEPDSPYLNFALANAFGAQNRWQEAQGYYFRALQNNPQDPNYAYNLAVSLEHISQPASAITYYRRALENFENGLATFNRDVVDQRLQLLGKL